MVHAPIYILDCGSGQSDIEGIRVYAVMGSRLYELQSLSLRRMKSDLINSGLRDAQVHNL